MCNEKANNIIGYWEGDYIYSGVINDSLFLNNERTVKYSFLSNGEGYSLFHFNPDTLKIIWNYLPLIDRVQIGTRTTPTGNNYIMMSYVPIRNEKNYQEWVGKDTFYDVSGQLVINTYTYKLNRK
ncbi:MAG: hypothetical protein KA101_00965 [Saprospiraceae bacterium]|nr:hypothetical protein [Saprospiraceae bacterium]